MKKIHKYHLHFHKANNWFKRRHTLGIIDFEIQITFFTNIFFSLLSKMLLVFTCFIFKLSNRLCKHAHYFVMLAIFELFFWYWLHIDDFKTLTCKKTKYSKYNQVITIWLSNKYVIYSKVVCYAIRNSVVIKNLKE